MLNTQDIIAQINQLKAQVKQKVQSSSTKTGTAGKDQLFGSLGDDVIKGLGGDDFISGSLGNDILDGGDGNDVLLGGNGDDILLGGNGNDQLSGGLDNDQLFGDAGDDNLDGSLGDDLLDGGDGNDILKGGPGNDQIIGGKGSDMLVGGSNAGVGQDPEIDFLVGGPLDSNGNPLFDGVKDTFVLGDANSAFYTSAGSNDYAVILGFEKGIDSIQLSSTVTYRSNVIGGDTFIEANLSTGPDLVAVVVGVNLLA